MPSVQPERILSAPSAVSRRTLLAGFGGACASVLVLAPGASASAADRSETTPSAVAPTGTASAVSIVQAWLNATYADRDGWEPIPQTGRRDAQTVAGVISALQAELGISPVVGSFGPLTFSTLVEHGAIDASNDPRFIRVLQALLIVARYSDGPVDGRFDDDLAAALAAAQTDFGLSVSAAAVPKLARALCTLDAFSLAPGGSAALRTVQQDLNRRYIGRSDFALVPPDGRVDRRLATALLYGVQYEIGLEDGVANGNFGPATRAGLRAHGLLVPGDQDADAAFVHLFQAALIIMGGASPYDGVFGEVTASVVETFQAHAALEPSGAGDFATWASLLVSTGDIDRPGAAVDAVTTVTAARAQALFQAGYRVIGRYLTNTPVADPLDKRIKPGELDTIFAAGMGVFPIFQEDGTEAAQFSAGSGLIHAATASAAAVRYGFLPGTTIYFAVDFDVTEDEVSQRIVPYFRSIRDVFASQTHGYEIGAYGPRGMCAVLEQEGLALNSFVGDLASGYAGNIATPLPGNWAFDQILETTIGDGAGAIAVDKNVMSGRDPGQTVVDVRG